MQSLAKTKRLHHNRTNNKYNRRRRHSVRHSNKQPESCVGGRIYLKKCYHCIVMAKDWKELLADFKHNSSVKMQDDIEAANEIKGVNKINKKYLKHSDTKLSSSGYPTIYKIQNGRVSYYEGPRDKQSMKTWFLSGGSQTENKNLFGFGGVNNGM